MHIRVPPFLQFHNRQSSHIRNPYRCNLEQVGGLRWCILIHIQGLHRLVWTKLFACPLLNRSKCHNKLCYYFHSPSARHTRLCYQFQRDIPLNGSFHIHNPICLHNVEAPCHPCHGHHRGHHHDPHAPYVPSNHIHHMQMHLGQLRRQESVEVSASC